MSFWRQPQRTRWRRIFCWLHLWAGVVCALYLCLIGTSGSLLVFEDEFRALAAPRGGLMPPGLPDVQAVVRAVGQARGGERVTYMEFPRAGQPFYRVWLTDAAGNQATLVADAATGAPLAGRLWIDWVHDLHVELLMGKTGETVNLIGASGLLLLTVTGLVLWWPGLARWARGLVVRWRSGWRRVNFDLHNALGFWALGFLLWWSISGIYFMAPAAVMRWVDAVSPLRGMKEPAPTLVTETSPAASYATILTAAQRAVPEGKLSGIFLAAAPGGMVMVYVDRGAPGDFSHRDILSFSSTGRLLTNWHYGENKTAGDWFLWAMYPLHFGSLWGLGFKILWALAGLSLPVLSVTGLLMYWNRRLRHLVHRG